MGKYIKGIDRGQLVLFQETIEDMINADAEVRVIDAFVESIDLKELKFTKSETKRLGTNHYDPKDLLKLYLYGYRNRVRSSRKLEQLCKTNIEVIWLLSGLKPNFRTISDFRKENVKSLKEVFKKMVLVCSELGLVSNKFSQDGVKIEAVNSKDRNFTLNKLDDRIKALEEKIESYLKELDESDKQEEGKLIKIEELTKRLKNYESMQKELESEKENQISLTDKDSRLMKNNGKFSVCYNNQILEDMEHHITVNYHIGNNPADVGSMTELVSDAKEMLGFESVVSDTTDKGYNDRSDMVKCLENGIIPEVTLPKGKEHYELETEYEEAFLTKEELSSENSKDIKKVLRSGNIPEAYKDYISDIEVVEKIEYETVEEISESNAIVNTEDLRDMAMIEKCFVRDLKSDKVYCPEGEILRKKSQNKGGIKYCNKEACKNCKNPCCNAIFKEVTFQKGQVVSGQNKTLKNKMNPKAKRKMKKKKVVRFKLTPKEENLKQRMGVSEHPHGTMKRSDGFSYFLLKGIEKVDGEMGLYYCASNLRRVVNIVGSAKLLEYFRVKIEEKYA